MEYFNFEYWYKVMPVRPIDGDTIIVDIDLGFGVRKREIIRLYGINTPELNSKNPEQKKLAEKAKKFVMDKMISTTKLTINTKKDKKGKYGRYLAEVYIDGMNLNDTLVDEGLAIYKKF